MSPIFAGLDGGGSRTRLVLVDSAGVELTRVEGPATALDGTRSAEQTAQVIEGLMQQATRAAGVELPLAGLWCGLAGASRTDLRAQLTDRLNRGRNALVIKIGSDADAAFAHAFATPDPAAAAPPLSPAPTHQSTPPHPPRPVPPLQVLLIAGTGSIVLTYSASGQRIRVGGWGPRFSDEGSGFWIGREAIALLLPLLEQGLPLPAWACHAGPAAPSRPPSSAAELATWANVADRRTIAELASHVLADTQPLEGAADSAACTNPTEHLVRRAVAALLELVDRAVRLAAPPHAAPESAALESAAPDSAAPESAGPATLGRTTPVHLALAGGLLAPARPLRRRLEHALAERATSGPEHIWIVPIEIDAALGAALLAQQLVTHGVRRPH